MRLIKLKRNQWITFLDIFIMAVVIIFVKTYMTYGKMNYSTLKKDNMDYVFRTDKEMYSGDDVVQFIFSMKNKEKTEKELIFERAQVFNLIIEKNNNLVFKRDLADSLTDRPKKIIMKRYDEKTFTYEWDMKSNTDFDIEKGRYMARLYSLDLEIEMPLEFIIE